MTETEAKWEERVRGWRESGKTAERFAEGQGFAASTLRYWASRLRPQATGASETSIVEPRETPRVRLVRVRRAGLRASGAAREGTSALPDGDGPSATMAIALGAVRIEVRPGFDRALLSDVLEVLGGAR